MGRLRLRRDRARRENGFDDAPRRYRRMAELDAERPERVIDGVGDRG
jgi:hypothetical protein